MLDGPRFVSRQERGVFIPNVQTGSEAQVQWVVGFFAGVKMTGAEIKNMWSSTSIPATFVRGADREDSSFIF
jgi:hypothetical protein